MKITYKKTKNLPNDQLQFLFMQVGWSNGKEDEFKLSHFNSPFKNSTFVFSAWDKDKLVGCVRVISDKTIRSIIQDLAVLPEYQKNGIGSALLKKCISVYPKSEWLIPTNKKNENFYLKHEFKKNNNIFLYKPCKWF